MMLILSCLAGLTFAADAEVSYTAGGTTAEGTMAEAVKAINTAKGGTIKLLKDYTNTETKENYFAISTVESFTLDLNGKTFTAAAGAAWVQKGATGVSEVKNGTIIARDLAWGGYGGLIMKDVTAVTEKKQTVAIYDATGKFNATNIIENCALYNPIWGCLAFNNTEDMSATSMTLKNTTLVSNKKTSAIVLQTKAVSGTVVLAEGVKIYTMEGGSAKAAAIITTGENLTKAEGTHSVTVGDKTATGMLMWTTPATATVQVEVPDVSSPEVEYTVNGETKTGTMAAAVKAVNAAKGGTVKLLKDYEYTGTNTTYAVVFNVPFVFDLNGFVFKSATRGIWGKPNADSVGVSALIDSVGTGYMDCKLLCFCVENGGIYVNGVKGFSADQQALAVNETSADWNDKSLIENSLFVSTKWGSLAYNNTKDSMEAYNLTLKNTTLVNAAETGGKAIVMQTKSVESNLTLGEGVKFGIIKEGTIASYVDNRLTMSGERPATADKLSVKVGDRSFGGLFCWATKAPAEAPTNVGKLADWAELGAVTAPSAPAAPATPAAPAAPTAPEAPKAETPAATGGATVQVSTDGGSNSLGGIIIAIVAAVVVAAAVVVVVVVLKKKKQ